MRRLVLAVVMAMATMATMAFAASAASAVNPDFPYGGDTDPGHWTGVEIDACGPPPDPVDACDIAAPGQATFPQYGECDVTRHIYLWRDGSIKVHEIDFHYTGTSFLCNSNNPNVVAYFKQGVDPQDDGTWLDEQWCAYTGEGDPDEAIRTRAEYSFGWGAGEAFGKVPNAYAGSGLPYPYTVVGTAFEDAQIGSTSYSINDQYNVYLPEEELTVAPDAENECSWPELQS